LALTLSLLPSLAAADRTTIGLTASGKPIEVVSVGQVPGLPRTVVVIGGLDGTPAAPQWDGRGFRVLTIPLANPDKATLVFPPTGPAYKENPESHCLWRWIGAAAPDLVVILSKEDFGLGQALSDNAVCGIGRIPVRRAPPKAGEPLPMSEAHREIERRLSRTPRQVALELAQVYGHDFPQAVYIPAMALIGRLRLGDRADVERIVAPFVDGGKDSLAKPTGSHLAGHLIFAELAEQTKDSRLIALVRRAADLTAEESPTLTNEMSDSVFMGCPILAKAGKLTGEGKYFDLTLQHLRFMQKLCLRQDGLYRNSPLCDAAWGRGNAFPALGLAFALSDLPRTHPAFAPLLDAFRNHIAALTRFQDEEGMWRQVIDVPGAYAEFSATAMIGTAMERGIRQGWLDAALYRPRVERAWQAISRRTAGDGRLMNVCESTGKQKSTEDYLRRVAILDRDPRGGGMALLFATELAEKF